MRTVPTSLWSATAIESGIECVMWMSSTSKGPSSRLSPGSTSSSSTSLMRCSSSLERAIAIVRRPPKTGGGRSSSRRMNGSAPMWSSWPCVITMPSMSTARSRRYVKSGSTRSMPSISAVGKRRPVSTTTIRPSSSTTVMFLPISPSPPRGRTRMVPSFMRPREVAGFRDRSLGGSQQPVALEGLADGGGLILVGRHQRQAQAADVVAQEVERGLDEDRVGDDEQRCEEVAELVVDRRALVGLVDHAAHLVADDVAGDGDDARAAHVERGGEDVVVARVDLEALDRREGVVVGLLDARDVIRERTDLGQEVVGDVERRPAGDVVE